MNIAATGTYSDNFYSIGNSTKRQTAAFSQSIAASIADKVSISNQAQAMRAHGVGATYDTDQGTQNIDIGSYFTPDTNAAHSSPNGLPPLLLPSPNNIKALSSHITAAMPSFLKRNAVPSPPSSITYDAAGQIQFPASYQYAAEFKQALERNPAMERELRTVNALSSHIAEMRKAAPFHSEYAAASSTAEQAAVVQKYSWLFNQNRPSSQIALVFDANGALGITADGQSLQI